jgi:hypothetical protein
MQDFLQQCIDLYLELAGKESKPLRRVTTPFIDQKPEEEFDSGNPYTRGRLAPHANKILMKILYAARMARFDLLRATNYLTTRITKWSDQCDAMLHRLVSYIHSTLEWKMYGWVGDPSWELDLCLYTDADFAGDPDTMRSTSGVFLALKSGEMAADAVDAALSAGTVSGSFFQEYGERLCESIENMRNLVYAFYDRNFSFADMLRKYPEMRGKLTDCLIGDVDGKDYSDLFARVAEFADLPEPLTHGRAPKEALSA